MTETVSPSQDDTKTESHLPQSASPSSPKSKPKALKHANANDGNERPRTSEKVEKPPTKVVVRRLPPTMTLETFLDQVAPLPPVDYMYFVKADSSLAPNSFARAYLHFVHIADLLIFTEKFDNYVFVDSKGNEYPAVVEFAPFQRIPKQRSSRKKDPRIGTIENDPYFQDFIEALKAEETQRKSASKTNKQHFFETSTSQIAPKVTSTPLLEYLKARRADKLRTKEDKIAEKRKREIERRKTREDARTSFKHIKTPEGDNDITPPTQIKIAGHSANADKISKEVSDTKRTSKDTGAKEIASKRRDEERNKGRDKDRKDGDKETRDSRKDSKRDVQKNMKDHDKDKENLPASMESKTKETRKGGKSYQEERQRLNERRLAAKGMTSKSSTTTEGGEISEKPEGGTQNETGVDRKPGNKKDIETTSESRNRPHEKFKNSDQHRQQVNREAKKFEKLSKSSRDQEPRRIHDHRKNSEDCVEEGKEVKKNVSVEKNVAGDAKPEESVKSQKEDTRKKSYNQEREQRRAAAADRKHQRRDSTQGNAGSNCETLRDPKENSKRSGSKQAVEGGKSDKERKSSDGNPHDEGMGSKLNAKSSGGESSDPRRKEGSSARGDEKDKKDPRAERRIRNKDRPSIEIYRPGMGRFSRQRMEREKGLSKGSSTERDSPSPSPSPVPPAAKSGVISEKDDE